MKRYILIALFHIFYVPVICAQSSLQPATVQHEQTAWNTTLQAPYVSYTMRSTSPMVGSGSRYVPEIRAVSYVAEPERRLSGPRRNPGDHHGEVHDDPIGDAAVPLMLLAMAYMAVRIMRKRRGALSK